MNETHLHLVGETNAVLFGMSVEEWQTRNWTRAGAGKTAFGIIANVHWVLSSGLASAVATAPGAALVEPSASGTRLVAVNLVAEADRAAVEALMAEPDVDLDVLRQLGLTPGDAVAIAGAYNAELRKRETPFAIDIAAKGVRAAEIALFKSSYKGVTDLVTKYAWPFPAFHVTKWCASLGLSPNFVTFVSLILCLAATWFFYQGDWALGFITGWLMTFLDTVDGKLARTTLTSSPWGNYFDHGIDLIHPPFWYLAWYYGIGADGSVIPDYALTSIIVIWALYIGGRIIEGIFIGAHGFHIHVWRPFDSVLRTYTARRNPNTLLFMLFVMAGAPAEGLAAVAIWSVVSNAIHLVRLFQAGITPATPPRTSWMSA